MQFCLLCRSFSARSQKQFCSKSEKGRANIINNQFGKRFFFETFSSMPRWQFLQTCRERSTKKSASIFSPTSKAKKVSKKNNLSLNVPVDKYNACFGNPAKTFCNTPQNSAKNREKTSIIFFIHQFFHNKFMRALDRSFDNFVGTLEPKVRKTFACYLLSQIFQFFSKVFFHKFCFCHVLFGFDVPVKKLSSL